MTKLCIICSKNVMIPKKTLHAFGYEAFQLTEVSVNHHGESTYSKNHLIKYICDVCRYKEGYNWLTNSPPTVESESVEG